MKFQTAVKEAIKLVKQSESSCAYSGFASKKPTKRMVVMKALLKELKRVHQTSSLSCYLNKCLLCELKV